MNSLNVNKSIEPRIKEHGVLVSEILGGENGIHKNSNIYFSNFKDSQEWMKALEWLVLKNNVKIINHSYGFTGDESLYQEKSYYLDYLSRKYGVINVFSSGNGEWNPKTLNEWINERKLAFNSIIVGALNDSNTNISYYSNWRVYEKYEDISKPFVLAPGTYSYYNNKLLNELGHWRTEYKVNKDIYVNGTSFSAPAVSGAISLFLSLEENNKINNDKNRVQSIKSIIAASSTELKIGKTKLSGFDSKSGSGILNFERMLKSKENLKNITIAKDEGNKTFVYTSEKFKLKKENKISIALSWLFNSGILKTPEWKKDFDVNIHGNYPISLVKNVSHPKETHENENKLTLKETFDRLGNKFFSDYDLYLQKENKDGKWEDIKISNSSTSNDELIRYTAENEGVYRIAIYKYSDSYQNSVDDNLALSYIID